MKKIIFLLVFLFATPYQFATAGESMRRCLLLPIHDVVEGGIGFNVYEKIEKYLKESDWCYYRSNSDIINILGNYKKNLAAHLENAEVLKVIAERSKAGSLIKINILNEVKGAKVAIKIYGDNGRDVYFKEKSYLKTSDLEVIARTLQNWLEIYEKTIPYDGRIVGVLGDQFTTDIGKWMGNKVGRRVKVVRPMGKKRHPLLKEIVEWEYETIGLGRIFHVANAQGQGKMMEYTGRKRPKNEDWIQYINPQSVSADKKDMFKKVKGYEFGKLGKTSLYFSLGSGSTSLQATAGNTNKLGGLLLGIDLEVQLWATRNYWMELDIGRKFGSFSAKEGSFTNPSNSMSQSLTKIKLGYKYLPMGFFYGPQIDGYIGYARYNYNLDTSLADNITETTFKGLMAGAVGSLPIKKDFRIYLGLDFILGPKYKEETLVFGEDDSSSQYSLVFGGSYFYAPKISINGEFEINSSRAKFKSPSRKITYKDSNLKIGTSFTF